MTTQRAGLEPESPTPGTSTTARHPLTPRRKPVHPILPPGIPSSLAWTGGLIGVTVVGLAADLYYMLAGAGRIHVLALCLTGAGFITAAIALFYLRTQHLHVLELAEVAGNLSAERNNLSSGALAAAGSSAPAIRLVGPFPVREDDEFGYLAARLNGLMDSVDQASEIANRERARTQSVLANMMNGVVLTDVAGRIVLANPAAVSVLGRPLEAILHHTVLETTHHNVLARMVESAAARGEAGSIPLYLEHSGRHLIARVSPLSEGPQGALIVFQDQEEQKRLDAVRRDFIANVSHELRTPLASIRAMAETVLTTAPVDPKTAVDFTEIIIREVDRLARLTDDILDLARYESGRLDRAEVDLRALLEEVIQQQQPSAAAFGLELRSEIGELPTLMADRSALRQVFLNLLENALKYTPAGAVTVRARTASGDEARPRIFAGSRMSLADRWAVVEVSDTGPGIAPEHHSRIFERLYRVDRGRSRDLGGTGLGLSIARHVTEAHGGRIELSSAPGQGATFTVWLPAAAE